MLAFVWPYGLLFCCNSLIYLLIFEDWNFGICQFKLKYFGLYFDLVTFFRCPIP